ncbi:MAG: twin-arginine translocase subunit TatC [Planctomycetaceae bacterium]|nr:twin-arginine translocase subunit TatC [Planctomycetaceae bacterium]
MEKLSRPKDDLFENSTMTFGEHLEDLRHSLFRAMLWLAGGLLIGLFFANEVVRFVQIPLEGAIEQFNADRDLHRLGYDPSDESVQELHKFLAKNALVWEIIYEVPEEFQALTMDSFVPPEESAEQPSETGEAPAPSEGGNGADAASASEGVVDPVEMAKILDSLPKKLEPKIQLRENKTSLSSLKMEEPFMIWVKAGLIVGAIIGSPGIFYHLWAFVAAGLHAHERKYVYIYLPVSVTLFVSGVILAFFLVLHFVLSFLLAFNGSMDVAVEPRLSYYVNFVLLLPLGFGIAFQLPLVMLFLQRIGLFETQSYIESWKVAVLVIFFVAMIVTPADVTSMIALAIPLIILYGLGILMCKFIPRGRGMGSDAYDPA